MPVIQSQRSDTQFWGVWRIDESEDTLLSQIRAVDEINDIIKHPHKRLEFVAGRVLLAWLLEQFHITYSGIRKDAYGKPFLRDNSLHISMSHSYPYVAAIVDQKKNTGIDIEQPKHNLLRVAPRILHKNELNNAGKDVIKHCVYWCAKETLIKIHGKKDLVFKEEMLVEDFMLTDAGLLKAHIQRKGQESMHTLHYLVEKEYILVFC
jgi:phosphopantetheinyl transferase